jgi:Rrf2 family nitric oxide-sensitive transcriptional repressor
MGSLGRNVVSPVPLTFGRQCGIVNTCFAGTFLLRLLASTDFALRVLMRLAAEPGLMRNTQVLSEQVGVPRNHLHKIVQDLVEAGFVRTLRGARGGVSLARPAAEIRLGAVVRHLEQDQALVECFRPDGGACCMSPDCQLRSVLRRAREGFLAVLDGVTLADCASRGAKLPAALAVT